MLTCSVQDSGINPVVYLRGAEAILLLSAAIQVKKVTERVVLGLSAYADYFPYFTHVNDRFVDVCLLVHVDLLMLISCADTVS